MTAPAGFGKSTLVSDWVRSHNYPVAWVSLDEADSDPARFIAHIIAAIQTIQPSFGETIVANLSGELPALETIFSALINDTLTFSDDMILVDG